MGDQYFKIISGSNSSILLEISRINNWYGNFLNICGGKINNDNFSDIMISFEDTSNQYAGKVEIFMGGANFDIAPDYIIEGNIPNRGLGTSIAVLGDLNNDNKKEIGIGEWYLGYPDTMGVTKTYIFSFGELNDIDDQDNNFPQDYELFQNYPNPFNSSTIIKYSIPKQEKVTLKIYDQLGRHITTLVDVEKNAGQHQVEFHTEKLSSGVYFYTLKVNGFFASRKMLLLK